MSPSRDHYARLVAIGIPRPYASQIARSIRKPSLRLALKIFRETGLKFGPLIGATTKDIEAAERISSNEAA